MSIVFSIRKFYICGWWGPSEFNVKLSTTYACLMHLLVQDMYIVKPIKVQIKLRCKFCLYGSTGDVMSGHYSASCMSGRATPKVCDEKCTEIVTEQSVCGATSVLLQTVVWSILAVDPLTAVSLADQCCT